MKKFAVPLLPLLFALAILAARSFREEPTTIQLPTEQVVITNDTAELIKSINEHNAKIQSLLSNDIDVDISNQPLRLKAAMVYEKQKNFRVLVASPLGKELDMGSNKDKFWFWSKRIRPASLYYASYDDIYLTRLKTPFHPVWMMESLGIGQIPLEKNYYSEKDNLLYVYCGDTSTLGVPVVRVIVIDKTSKCIVAQHIFQSGELICSTEIEHVMQGEWRVPAKVTFKWVQEKRSMQWRIRNIAINASTDAKVFQLPSIEPQVDMSKD